MELKNENILIDSPLKTKEEIFAKITELAFKSENVKNKKDVIAAFKNREKEFSTAFEDGFAIPHAKSATIQHSEIYFIQLKKPLDWGSLDGKPTQYVFGLLIPENSQDEHLNTLSFLATKLLEKDFKENVKKLKGQKLLSYLNSTLNSSTKQKKLTKTSQKTKNRKNVIAITACAAGIAHTYMAAKILEEEFKKKGFNIKVEKQGAAGIEDQLTIDDIQKADVLVMCVDVEPKMLERFTNIKQLKYKVAEPLHKMDKIIQDVNEMIEFGHLKADDQKKGKNNFLKVFVTRDLNNWKTSLLTGISYMVPVIIAGGMFQAIMVLLQQIPAYHDIMAEINGAANKDEMIWQYWYLYWPTQLGSNLLNWIMVPVLAAYMSYALAEKPGLAPGFAAGMAAIITNSGFIGGMIGGLIAGYTMRWIKRFIRVKPAYQGFLNFWLYPTLGIIIVGAIMLLGFGWPLAKLTKIIVLGMMGMPSSARVGMGILVGIMVVFDLGGPINKAAYAFAIAAISEKYLVPYAIFASVKMVPCFATTLATLFRPSLFAEDERLVGKTTWIMGLAGITEPNIPFALKDPLRVIPSYMVGAAVTGGIMGWAGVGLSVPGAGIISMAFLEVPEFLTPITAALLWLGAAILGAILSTMVLLMLKEFKSFRNIYQITFMKYLLNKIQHKDNSEYDLNALEYKIVLTENSKSKKKNQRIKKLKKQKQKIERISA